MWRYLQRDFVFGKNDSGHIRNLLACGRNSAQRSRESKLCVVEIRRCLSLGLVGVRHTRKGELGIPPGKLAIAQPRMESDLVANVLRNTQAEVNRIRGTGRNQVHVDDRA